MIKPQEGQMNIKNEDELWHYYMFINACLTEDERNELAAEWEKQGGVKTTDWWKFVKENTKICLDIK